MLKDTSSIFNSGSKDFLDSESVHIIQISYFKGKREGEPAEKQVVKLVSVVAVQPVVLQIYVLERELLVHLYACQI